MYERILIPLDGSKIAQRAIPFAVCLPARTVRLLRVEPESAALGPGPPIDFEPDWREVRTAQAREELTPVGNQLRESGATVELAVEFCNDAAAAIMAAAADVELIVMTTRGRGGAGRALLGSVADRVVRHATTPILLVRAARRAVSPVMATRIVVPLDGSLLAAEALPIAAKLARTLDLPVYLVRVVDVDREEILCGEARPDDFKHEATAYLTEQVARLEGQGLVVNHDVRTGNPVWGLLHSIRPGDIVVMTSHGRGGSLRRLLGSVAEELVRRAAAPVLLVPSAGRGTTVDATHSRSG